MDQSTSPPRPPRRRRAPRTTPCPPLWSAFRVDPASASPRRVQVVDFFRQAILTGRLGPGSRLPSSRTLAAELGLARQTVVLAYEELTAEGYLDGRTGAGTFVAAVLPERWLHVRPSPTRARLAPVPRPSSASRRAEQAVAAWRRRPVRLAGAEFLPLTPGISALDAFPVRIWERLSAAVLRRLSPAALDYGDPAGHRPLRAALAAHLAVARGVVCEPEQIILTSGSQQGIDLTARVLTDPGDTAWVENPGYVAGRGAFLANGITLAPVPVDGEGIDPALGERLAPHARLALVAPAHQFPLGVTLSLRRRLALLDWAERAGAWILEDDYDGENRYVGAPLQPLRALDRGGRVIYLGTFSKVLAPGLRVGYLVVPAALVDAFLAVRAWSDRQPPTLVPTVLAAFLAEGHLSRHVRRMRTLYAERRAALLDALARDDAAELLAPGPAEGGLHLSARLLRPIGDAALASHLARSGQAGARALSEFALLATGQPCPSGLVLGFGHTPVQQIAPAVRQVAAAIRRAPHGEGEARCRVTP